MKSPVPGSSTYRSLAQQQAAVDRALDLELLPRLKGLCASATGLAARVQFDQDDQGRVRCRGTTSGSVSLSCHRCDEFVDRQLASNFTALVAFDEEQAQSWQDQGVAAEVIVVRSPNLDISELVEDEFLLALPERVCLDEECKNMPAMAYGDDGSAVEAAAAEPEPEGRFPFAGLRQAMEENEGGKP